MCEPPFSIAGGVGWREEDIKCHAERVCGACLEEGDGGRPWAYTAGFGMNRSSNQGFVFPLASCPACFHDYVMLQSCCVMEGWLGCNCWPVCSRAQPNNSEVALKVALTAA